MIQIALLFLLCCNFFGVIEIPHALKAVVLIVIASWGIKKKTPYKTAFIFIFGGLLCSFISSYINRGQTFIESFMAIPYYLGILFYFYLKYKDKSYQDMERLLVKFILVYDLMFICQHFLYSMGINFMHIPKWSEGGQLRMRAIASGFYSLGLFLGLVKLECKCYNKRLKWQYLAMVIMGLFCMILTAYRQFFVSFALAFGIYLLIKNKGISKKNVFTILGGLILLLILWQLPIVQEQIGGIFDRQDSGETLDNKDYIRIVQWDFYMNGHFFKNGWEQFFGAGLPYFGNAYGHYMNEELAPLGLLYVDWGLIGQSWVLGTLTVIGYLLMSLKACFMKVNPEYVYIRLWYVFLLLSVTNYEFTRDGNFLIHAYVIYMAEIAAKDYKMKKSLLCQRK